MTKLIVLIIFVLSFGGVLWILTRKIPVLIQMPEVQEGIKKENIFSVLRKKIRSASPDKIILLKILSKIRIFVLKIEKYIDGWLQKMRKKMHTQKQEQEKEIQEPANMPIEDKERKKEQNNPPASGPPTIPPTMPE